MSASTAGVGTAEGTSAVDTAASDVETRLARIEALLEGLEEDARRRRERWQAIDELITDASPFVGRAVSEVQMRLQRMEDKGYGQVLGAGASVLDRAVESFDAESVDALGDNLLILLKTLRKMS